MTELQQLTDAIDYLTGLRDNANAPYRISAEYPGGVSLEGVEGWDIASAEDETIAIDTDDALLIVALAHPVVVDFILAAFAQAKHDVEQGRPGDRRALALAEVIMRDGR